MAIPDGKPATDFSAMNREWVRAVAAEAGGLPEVSGDDNGKVLTVVSGEWEAATASGGGIPAPASPSDGDVLTYDGTTSSWVAEEPSGSGGNILIVHNNNGTLDKTLNEIITAYKSGYIIFIPRTTIDEDDEFLCFISYLVSCSWDNTDAEDPYGDCKFISAATQPVVEEAVEIFETTTLNGYPTIVQ